MRTEFWFLFAFGLVFLVTRLFLAVRFPNPTSDQEGVFRTVLSLSAAGIAGVVPGFLQIDSQIAATTISATGALAVFVLVYLFNPGMVRRSSSARSTDQNKDKDLQLQALQVEVVRLSKEVATLSSRLDASIESSSESEYRHVSYLEPSLELEKLRMEARESRRPSSSSKIITIFLGLMLVGTIIIYGLYLPHVTSFQYALLRVVLALMGGLLGALLPGTLNVGSSQSRPLLRLTGGMAMFVLIYFLAARTIQ